MNRNRASTAGRARLVACLPLALALAACGVSTQQEVDLGQQQSQQINAQLPLVDDPAVNAYVNQLGDEIASHTSRADLPWKFYVVNTDIVNAFALPGGIIYINRGVIARASNMSELAGVMSHEISHVLLRHSVKQMEQMQGANVGVALGCTLLNVCQSQAAQAAIQIGGTAVFAKFSRDDERQADEQGVRNMVADNINPRGMLTFFQKLLAEEQQSGGGASGVSAWFSDHPGTQDRIADIQNMLSQMPASQFQSERTDTQAFESMKARLSRYPAPPPGAKQNP